VPVETLPGSDERYYLIAFDAEGRERADDPDGLMSERVSALLAAEPYTDVVLLSHGWRGDVPSARQQYGRWIGAMLASTADLERVRQARPDFRPLFVGLHWPSEPWGDEELGGGAFGAAAGPPIDDLVERYAERLGDTPEEREAARPALRTIFDALRIDTTPAGLPDEVLAAYAVLDDVSGLGASGPGAAPGDDRQPFDAQAIYQEALAEPASYGEFTQIGRASCRERVSVYV
jgi:hypothetical protein